MIIARVITAAVSCLIALCAQPSKADIIVTSAPGLFSAGAVNLNGDITFDSISTSCCYPGTSIATGAVPASINGIGFSGTAFIARNAPGTAAGISATPAGDDTNYMSILGGGSETLSMPGVYHQFGLYWGSIDAYNQITFLLGDVEVASYSGNTLNAQPPVGSNGDQSSSFTNAYISFSGLSFDKVVLSSTGNSFEFDNISAAVPEPSTWAMLILGFAGVGFMVYRRKNGMALSAA